MVTDGLVLSAQGLRKRYGGVVALDDVSFSVARGEILGVIGPNGAGKSTLLKAVAGHARPDSGEIWLGSQRIDRLPAHRAAHLGVTMAYQIPRPFGGLTVRQNILVGALSRRNHRRHVNARVDAVLDATGLSDKATRAAATLPLLDRKRLELARAMAGSPDLILLDEIGAGLLPAELDSLITLLRKTHGEGVAMIIVEHVEELISRLAHRVIVLDWGRVITEGTPQEVAADPRVRELYLGSGPSDRSRDGGDLADPARLARRGHAPPLLRLESVSASYDGARALSEVGLEVPEGGLVAVLGANGAGKTTLAAVVSGLKAPDSGRLLLDGTDITRRPAHARVKLGIAHCPEGRRMFAGLTVAENLEMGRYAVSDAVAARQRSMLHEVFPLLAERAGQQAQTLSGGQQQMLAIARALMSAPRLLVLDEVSLGLAPVAIDTIYAALRAISESGVSILLVEQNVHRSLAVAGNVCVLDHGRVSFSGRPDELLRQGRLWQVYFGGAPIQEGHDTQDKGDSGVHSAR
jgi:ABC-type branched-subunit amino acid transport system ATPase component